MRRWKLYMLTFAVRAVAALLFTAPFAVGVCLVAANERGYAAIGGEWVAVAVILAAIWKMTGFAAKEVYTHLIERGDEIVNVTDNEKTVCRK